MFTKIAAVLLLKLPCSAAYIQKKNDNIFKMILVFMFCLFVFVKSSFQNDYCYSDGNDVSCEDPKLLPSTPKQKKYLLYDVNPGEGFNLRRDVYMRVATLVKKLNEENQANEWILVLPPWGPLYHWKTKHIGLQAQIQWSVFFDLPSLRRYCPVMEFQDFLKEYGGTIDILYYLQHYAEGWENGIWKERADIRDCIESPPYHKIAKGVFTGWFWNYDQVSAKQFHCLSIQGYSSTLKRYLGSSSVGAIMIDRAEVILHDTFGNLEYWMVRRSMVFSKELRNIGDKFRKSHLNSTDEKDKTNMPDSLISSINRKATGGPYVAVHLRRRDFIQARPKDVPSIANAAQQILKFMKRLKITILFVATDASQSEFEEIQQYIPGAQRFIPSYEMLEDIFDGGVAIVDQWICAHSQFFIGSFESTFSFRIQEEREILGFPAETTFNRLCGDDQKTCTQPSKWTIVFS